MIDNENNDSLAKYPISGYATTDTPASDVKYMTEEEFIQYAAKRLKEYCIKQNGCFNGCIFHGDGGGCHINVDAEPEYWEV